MLLYFFCKFLMFTRIGQYLKIGILFLAIITRFESVSFQIYTLHYLIAVC